MVKNLPAMQETRIHSLDREDPLEKERAAHSSILPEEFHGQRSLAGYSPRGQKESDTTKGLTLWLHMVLGVNFFLFFFFKFQCLVVFSVIYKKTDSVSKKTYTC